MAPRPMSERRIFSRLEPSCLWPDDEELAILLIGRERAHLWPAIAKAEEKAGLPRVSLQYGGRYWPAVKAFYDRRHLLLEQQSEIHDDERAKENWGTLPVQKRR
jgi:hypothetical protein